MSMSLMRKYSKPLMAVFGVVLMITFLLGYAYTSGSGSGAPTMVIGHMGTTPITNTQLVPYQIDVHVLKIMAQNDPRFAEEYMNWEGNSSRSDLALKFFLLAHEARRYGLLPDNGFPADMQGTKAFDRAIASVTASSNFAVENVAQALGQLSMVDRMYQLATQTSTPSRPQVLHYVTRITTSLQMQYVRLSAREWTKHHPIEPTPVLTKLLFNRYKSVLPWNPLKSAKPPMIDGARYPFGFRFPNRVRLEFIKFSAADLAKTMHPSLNDVSAAYTYYKTHKSDFEIAPAKTVKGVKKPAKYQSFDSVKAELVRDQIDKKIQALFVRMASAANHMANRPWKAFDATGFRKRIAATKWVHYSTIVGKLAARFGYKPQVGRITNWESASQLDNYQDLSTAETASGVLPQSEGVAYLAMRVRALDPHSQGDGLLLHLQVGRQGPVLTNRTTGDVYVYRVTAVSPAHDPKNIKQVQSKVLHAAKLYLALKTLAKQGSEIAASAPRAGLIKTAAVHHLAVKNSGVFHPLTPKPLYPGVPQSPRVAVPARINGLNFRSRKLVGAAFNLAYAAHLHGAKTTAFSSLTKSELTALASGRLIGPHHPAAVVVLHRYLLAIVMQLGGYDAVPANALKNPMLLEGAEQAMLNDPSQQAYVPWFAMKQIEARMQYKAAH